MLSSWLLDATLEWQEFGMFELLAINLLQFLILKSHIMSLLQICSGSQVKEEMNLSRLQQMEQSNGGTLGILMRSLISLLLERPNQKVTILLLEVIVLNMQLIMVLSILLEQSLEVSCQQLRNLKDKQRSIITILMDWKKLEDILDQLRLSKEILYFQDFSCQQEIGKLM